MTPITGRIPTDWIEYAPTGSWEVLVGNGAIPPGSTGVLIQCPGMHWCLDPTVTGSATGLILGDNDTLRISDGADLLALTVKASVTLRMQFFTGPTGSLPAIIQPGAGGGGGGGVTSVTATAPLQSSGGATPNISVQPGSNGDILFHANGQWIKQSSTMSIIWVDSINGNDGYPLAGNRFQPYASIPKAEENAAEGDLICVLPGIYEGSWSSGSVGVSGVHYYLYPGAEIQASIRGNGVDPFICNFYGHGVYKGVIYDDVAGSRIFIEGTVMPYSEWGPVVLAMPGVEVEIIGTVHGNSHDCLTTRGNGLITIRGNVEAMTTAIRASNGTIRIYGDLNSRDAGIVYPELNWSVESSFVVDVYGETNCIGRVADLDGENAVITFHGDVHGTDIEMYSSKSKVELRGNYTTSIHVDRGPLLLSGAARGYVTTDPGEPFITGSGAVHSFGSWGNRPLQSSLQLTGEYNEYPD